MSSFGSSRNARALGDRVRVGARAVGALGRPGVRLRQRVRDVHREGVRDDAGVELAEHHRARDDRQARRGRAPERPATAPARTRRRSSRASVDVLDIAPPKLACQPSACLRGLEELPQAVGRGLPDRHVRVGAAAGNGVGRDRHGLERLLERRLPRARRRARHGPPAGRRARRRTTWCSRVSIHGPHPAATFWATVSLSVLTSAELAGSSGALSGSGAFQTLVGAKSVGDADAVAWDAAAAPVAKVVTPDAAALCAGAAAVAGGRAGRRRRGGGGGLRRAHDGAGDAGDDRALGDEAPRQAGRPRSRPRPGPAPSATRARRGRSPGAGRAWRGGASGAGRREA